MSNKNYFDRKNKLMLSIVSSSTPITSNPDYQVINSIPDACIHNKDTAILIEVKTQSPLIKEQIDAHIKQNLGVGSNEKTITWEDITRKFRIILDSLNALDRFLVSQFIDFLGLIGIAEFNGFRIDDFLNLGLIGKIPSDDYLDHKRIYYGKVEKFMALLQDDIKNSFDFKNFGWKIAKISSKYPGTWAAYYFYDDDPGIGVNDYPNLNFNFREQGIELCVNAEVQKSVGPVISLLKNKTDEFENTVETLKDFQFSLYYKLQYAPRTFFWNLIPGFPIDCAEFNANETIAVIDSFKRDWTRFRKTHIFEMKSGIIKQESGDFFTEKQIAHAQENSGNPNFVFRIENRYSSELIADMKKGVVKFFSNELNNLKDLANFFVT
jgi:hypothetical protein